MNTTSSIICPECHSAIEVAEILRKQTEEAVRSEFRAKYIDERKKLEEQYAQKAMEQVLRETQQLKQLLASREEEMKRFAEEQRQQQQMIEEQTRKRAEEQLAVQIHSMQEQITEQQQRLQEARQQQVDMLRKQRELEEREQTLTIETERKLAEERMKIWDDATAKLQESHRLKEAEKDKTIDDMRRQIEELNRKAELSSQQLQGEVAEIELTSLLREHFRYDDIADVPKGVRGADVIQTVKNQLGIECGTIIWESKRTKGWSNEWIPKLKDDMRSVKANIAVIVSSTLPKGVERLANVEGVWVTDFSSAMGLASALRQGLVDVARAKTAMEGRNEKMEMVYEYLAGDVFRQRVQAIMDVSLSLKKNIEDERRAMERIWAQREKQVERLSLNTIRMYGDLQGIIGNALPTIPTLELPDGDEE